jgi:hypothetical protein
MILVSGWIQLLPSYSPNSFILRDLSARTAATSHGWRSTCYWIVFALICVLVGGNLENGDREGYEQNYYDLRDGFNLGFEPGHQLFAWIFSNLGASYELFAFAIAVTAITLIASTVRVFTDRPTMVLMMYAAYPMFWDYVQVRNFMAMSVLIYAARYVISPVKRLNHFLLFVLLGATFHVTSLFYLVCALMAIRRTRDFVIASICVFAVYAYALTIFIELPLTGIALHKVESYALTETSLTTKAAIVLFYMASLVLIYVTHLIIRDRQIQVRFVADQESETSIQLHVTRVGDQVSRITQIDSASVLRLFWLMGFCLPLVLINLDFMRLFRNVFVVSAICFVVALHSLKNALLATTYGAAILIYVATCFAGFVFYLAATPVVGPIFSSNAVVSLF